MEPPWSPRPRRSACCQLGPSALHRHRAAQRSAAAAAVLPAACGAADRRAVDRDRRLPDHRPGRERRDPSRPADRDLGLRRLVSPVRRSAPGRDGESPSTSSTNCRCRPWCICTAAGRRPTSDGYPTDLILPADRAADWTAAACRATPPSVGGSIDIRCSSGHPPSGTTTTRWISPARTCIADWPGSSWSATTQDDALPLPRGDRDLPLMVCDRSFAADGSLRYPALSADQSSPGVQTAFMGGVLGDVVLVNGVPWPQHEVDGARYRLRLLNASNARRFEFALDPPPPGGSSVRADRRRRRPAGRAGAAGFGHPGIRRTRRGDRRFRRLPGRHRR